MSEKKQLNEQELEKVSGGSGLGYASAENLPTDHGAHISEWEAVNYKGQEVYFVSDDNEESYGYGTLIDSVYKQNPYIGSCYAHSVLVKYTHNYNYYPLDKVANLNSNYWTLYKKNN